MYIDFDLDDVLEVLSKKMDCKDMLRDDIEELIPRSVDRKTLIDFYLKTGLTVTHYFDYRYGEKTLMFNRCGSYPIWDMGSGAYLFASGDYAKRGGDIKLLADVIIEEEVQFISQTDDGKNYIIVPFGVDLFEVEDDFGTHSDEYCNSFVKIVEPKVKFGFDYSEYLIPITQR